MSKKRLIECGICGELYPQDEMYYDGGSSTNWICDDCYNQIHPEHEEEF